MTERALKKRSLTIAGHRSSLALEDIFWRALEGEAKTRGVSLNHLVSEIDAGRGEGGLASAIRVWLFARARS